MTLPGFYPGKPLSNSTYNLKMPDTYDILLGALIGGAIMYLSHKYFYHSVSRKRDRVEDKKLRERLRKIEGEDFDFEKEQ